jgi:hypothetical protein
LYDLHQDHHDCDNQKNVNESTHGVGRDKANQPKNNQDNCNRSKHFRTSFVNAEPNRIPAMSAIQTLASAGVMRQPTILNQTG